MCPALHRAGEQPPVCHLSLNYQMDSKWLKIALKHFLPTPIREIFCWRLRVRKHLPTCPNTGITWSPAPAVLLKFARQLPVCTLQAPYLASAMWLYSDLWSSGVLLRRLFFQVKYSEKTVLCILNIESFISTSCPENHHWLQIAAGAGGGNLCMDKLPKLQVKTFCWYVWIV